MSQLDQIRTKINDIDEKMAALFEERMHMSEQVAAFKRERGLSVRDAERERELIARSAACIGDEAVGSYYAQFLRKVIDLSCAYQTRLMEGMQVAYCGVEGDFPWSELVLVRNVKSLEVALYSTKTQFVEDWPSPLPPGAVPEAIRFTLHREEEEQPELFVVPVFPRRSHVRN